MSNEIHPAVELLIKRMKSNPEEFMGNAWNWTLTYAEHFTEEENNLIKAETRKLRMEQFHAKIMKQLLDPQPQQPDLFAASSAKPLIGKWK
jgi:hypothetical protein